jgi:hypothetical protein
MIIFAKKIQYQFYTYFKYIIQGRLDKALL